MILVLKEVTRRKDSGVDKKLNSSRCCTNLVDGWWAHLGTGRGSHRATLGSLVRRKLISIKMGPRYSPTALGRLVLKACALGVIPLEGKDHESIP